jgi:anaphase-promoting complex subunit 3
LFRFFQRAVQVDSRFAYAYTLLGHEYVLVEELEKALSCFRTAVRHAGDTKSNICGTT